MHDKYLIISKSYSNAVESIEYTFSEEQKETYLYIEGEKNTIPAKLKLLACGYVYYDNIEEVKFKYLPNNWTCLLYRAGKDMFEKVEEWRW